jgi:hypothetical protein
MVANALAPCAIAHAMQKNRTNAYIASSQRG